MAERAQGKPAWDDTSRKIEDLQALVGQLQNEVELLRSRLDLVEEEQSKSRGATHHGPMADKLADPDEFRTALYGAIDDLNREWIKVTPDKVLDRLREKFKKTLSRGTLQDRMVRFGLMAEGGSLTDTLRRIGLERHRDRMSGF